jgi:hypothetical protein
MRAARKGVRMPTKKSLLLAAGSLGAGVALIGVLHLPFARGLLMRIGGCPFGNASVAEVEPARNAAVAAERGAARAPVRPALGFDLDRTTAADVRRWAEAAGVACTDVREGLMSCKNVPAHALGLSASEGPIGELNLGFSTKGRLVDVSTMRMHVASAQVARDVEKTLASKVGAPQQTTGSFEDAHLALEGAQSLATVRYRYRDYFADVIAMRFGADGLVLREHYLSATD